MYKKKLVLGTSSQFNLSLREQVKLFNATGFEGAFINWSSDYQIEEFANAIKECKMDFQSIHAPYTGMASIWEDNYEKAHATMKELFFCLEDCKRYNAPIMVIHSIIGFDKHTPNQIGIDRLGELVKSAEGSGVKIAFENTEGIEYHHAVMNAFKGNDTVGFCWDSGHEMCYNFYEDLLALYGDRLLCTHLNDNLGIKDLNGNITWKDDLHLLPFDGIADWNYNMSRLKKIGFEGPLTFELCKNSKPDRHENDKYSKLSIEEYVAEAYACACKLGKKML